MSDKKRTFPADFTSTITLDDKKGKKQKLSRVNKPPANIQPNSVVFSSGNGAGTSSSEGNSSNNSNEAKSSHVNVASDVRMTPKALKACRACRRSKTKCETGEKADMKCKRCLEQGFECIYEIKVPTNSSSVPDAKWMSTVETRLDKFGTALDSILTLLKGPNAMGAGSGTAAPVQEENVLPEPVSNQIDSEVNPPMDGGQRAEQNGQNEHDHNDEAIYKSLTGVSSNTQESISQLAESSPNGGVMDMFMSPRPQDSTATPPLRSNEDTHIQHVKAEDLYSDVLFETDRSPSNGGGADMITTNSIEGGNSVSPSNTSNNYSSLEGFYSLFDLQSDSKDSYHDSKDFAIQHSSETVESVSFSQAEELFQFFHEKISPHLFGFPISHYGLPVVWKRSPILVAAICTVASAHHTSFSDKFNSLKSELERMAQRVMFKTMHSEAETLDTIVALCVAGFWLPNSFMLTSVALRLAQNLGLSMPKHVKDQIQMGTAENVDKERLRLWYLLYILDGHQSLVYNQVPSIDYDDPAVMNSRTFLLSEKNDWAIQSQQQLPSKQDSNSPNVVADMRLVSQVEFNQAVKSIFEGRGWDLLRPSSIGIPWQTNIDLDKWMVSWACLLTPTAGDMGSWPSKSTLIHYNFAKMHINSKAIRDVQSNNCSLGDLDLAIASSRKDLSRYENDEDSSDGIAISAAQNVLRLSTTDKDILSALQYVPVHIHMMLYYSALLVLHSLSLPSASNSAASKRAALGLVRRLRQAMLASSSSTAAPSSNSLVSRIAEGLDTAVANKTRQLQQNYHYQITDLIGGEEESSDSRGGIAGWPGSISSHLRP